MASLDINEVKTWKKFPNQRKHFVGNIFTHSAPNKERRLLESDLLRILVGEVAKIVERAAKDVQRDTELLRFPALGSVKVPKQKLTNGKGLFLA